MAGEIFISYRRADEAWARLLYGQLQAEGIEAWYDAHVPAGEDWRLATAKALEDSKIFVLLFSENAAQSSDMVKELAVATLKKKLIIPVRLQNIEPKGAFLYELASRNWINAYEHTEARLSELAKDLGNLVRSCSTEKNAPPIEHAASLIRQGTISICVLPFANIGGNVEQECFCDSICEDIITDLSKVSSLSVVARNTAFTFKGKSMDVTQIARQLGVSHILSGSVRQSGGRVRISAQLVDGATGNHVWADRYDRDLSDIFALQDEISKTIVGALRLQLTRTGDVRATTRRDHPGAEGSPDEAQQMALPVTQYAKSGDVSIAYQVMGDGPIDLIIVPGIVSHVEFLHEFPGYTAFLRRLSAFARVITFDKRGQGLSDRITGVPSLEIRMDDVRAVMDAVSSERAAFMGFSEGCAMSVLFAATYPQRVSHLLLFAGFSAYRMLQDDLERRVEDRVRLWGTGALIKTAMPSQTANPEAVQLVAKFERLSASPGAIRAYTLMNCQIDIRPVLPSINVPTLVMHRLGDLQIPIELGRDLAKQIRTARMIEYPGEDHAFFSGDTETLLGDIQEFITGSRDETQSDLGRVLATVLFTDIVVPGRNSAQVGDPAWRRALDNHEQLAKQMIEKHRGKFIKSTGDGILATFDGPGRAVRCALAFESAAKQIGLPVRAGLHTGEIEQRSRSVGGIAVHAAARVMEQCAPGEVWVSRVVTDLVAGTGLTFAERGSHELKGLPGRWELFAAIA